jgi:hypothetical protein
MAGFEVRAATGRDGPRMAELDRLAFGCEVLTERGVDVGSLGLQRVAPWYVAQCAALFEDARVWPRVKREPLALPPPAAPDPVLDKYLKDRGAEVAAVLIDWIEDPASCNCSALVAIRNPRCAGGLIRQRTEPDASTP